MANQEKQQLEATHPVCILMDEHELISLNLDELQRIMWQVDALVAIPDLPARLGEIAQLFLEAESHHKREEETLFSRLERQGMTDLPQLLRREHEELRGKKESWLNSPSSQPASASLNLPES